MTSPKTLSMAAAVVASAIRHSEALTPYEMRLHQIAQIAHDYFDGSSPYNEPVPGALARDLAPNFAAPTLGTDLPRAMLDLAQAMMIGAERITACDHTELRGYIMDTLVQELDDTLEMIFILSPYEGGIRVLRFLAFASAYIQDAELYEDVRQRVFQLQYEAFQRQEKRRTDAA